MTRQVLAVVFLLVLSGSLVGATSQQAAGCSLRQPSLSVPRKNIFTAQQEQWLGDALADKVEPRHVLLPAEQSAYLTQLGQKLLAQLPPTALPYSFRIYEAADVDSFSLPGHVYVSRKLVLDTLSEDELAGVLAHEIGRIYIHHAASAITLQLDKLMKVKSLGDRDDVFDKFQRLQNLEKTTASRLTESEEQADALLADQVGFYALIEAGYAPKAYATFLDRVNLNEGRTGNFFTDLLDSTPEVSLRLRMAKKLIASLPEDCRHPRPLYGRKFKQFQDWLSAQRVDPMVAPTEGLTSIQLDPPLSPALESVRLSPDARYVLAQDDSKIHVLTTAPLKLLFSIDAAGPSLAQFTPDSAGVVFRWRDLRFEDWNVATGQPTTALDFIDYSGCLQSSLSPDGHTFACFSQNGNTVLLKLTDVGTGRIVYQIPNFFVPSFDARPWNGSIPLNNGTRQGAVAWSQDGRYFLAASGTVSFAFDLTTGTTVNLGHALAHVYESRMAFVDSDKLAFECDWGTKNGGPLDTFKFCYTHFPDGQPIKTFTLGRNWVSRVTAGAQLLTGPWDGAAAALFDPATATAGQLFKLETVDLARNTLAVEAEGGGLSVGPLGGKLETVPLPVTPLSFLEAVAFSADGRSLAYSNRARGATWDLSTGKQLSHSGPFRSAAFDEQGHLQALAADRELKPSRDEAIDRRTGKVSQTLSALTEKVQYGSVLVRYRPLDKDQTVSGNAAIEAFDAVSGKPLWSRRFPHEAPGLVQADGDKLLLVMDRRTVTAGNEVDRYRKLEVRTADLVKEWIERGILVEVISGRTGVPERLVLAPEASSSETDQRTVSLYGDMLAIHGNDENTVIYRVSDGARLLAIFGNALAGDTGLGLIAATNRPQELTIYEVAAGREVRRATLDHLALAARFVPEKRQLLVLTATQRVYTLDLSSAGAKADGAR